MGRRLSRRRLLLALALAAGALLTLGAAPAFAAKYAVFAVNDLGMHCYQRSYAGFMILPPANNLKVQVFRKGAEEARPVTSGIRVSYVVLGNTKSANKTDFWTVRLELRVPGPQGQRRHHRPRPERPSDARPGHAVLGGDGRSRSRPTRTTSASTRCKSRRSPCAGRARRRR